MSKLIWLIVIIAFASIFFYSQNPPEKGSNEVVCVEGDFLEGFCDENTYYFDECVDGFYHAAELNCSPKKCDAESLDEVVESACIEIVEEIEVVDEEENLKEVEGEEKRGTSEELREWFSTLPSCGNGVCVKPENCGSCPQDCSCGEGEYCREEWGSCELINDCGDNICTSDEEETCCTDCGCSDESICDLESQQCVELPDSMPEIDGLTFNVEEYLLENEYYNQSIAAISYYVSNNEIFALVITNCERESDIVCDLWVTVNSTGNVIGVAQPA